MVTNLLSLQLAFRALSDDPEGDNDDNGISTGADEGAESLDGAEDEEDVGKAPGFSVEEEGGETAE